MTKAEAKKYSLIKWDYARKTGCDNSELEKWFRKKNKKWKSVHSCAYCEYSRPFPEDDCTRCPLFKVWNNHCLNKKSLWFKWYNLKTIKVRKKYAEKIYQDIKRS